MVPSEECFVHAARSEHMAKSCRDPKGKAIWSKMAKRWIRRAEDNKTQENIAPPPRTRFAPESLSGLVAFTS